MACAGEASDTESPFVLLALHVRHSLSTTIKEYAGLFTAHFDRESNERSRSNKDKANNE
jgi:hypothetical protein